MMKPQRRTALNLSTSRLVMGEDSSSNAWVTPVISLLKKNNKNYFFLGKECRAELVNLGENIFVQPSYEVSQVLGPDSAYFIRSGVGALPNFFSNHREVLAKQINKYSGGMRVIENYDTVEEISFDQVLESLKTNSTETLYLEFTYRENSNEYQVITKADYINYPVKGDEVYLQPIAGQIVVEETGLPTIAYFSTLIKKEASSWSIKNSEIVMRDVCDTLAIRRLSRRKVAFYLQKLLSYFGFNILKISDFTKIKKVNNSDIRFFKVKGSVF